MQVTQTGSRLAGDNRQRCSCPGSPTVQFCSVTHATHPHASLPPALIFPAGDWRLAHWKKAPLPIISLPPPNLNLAGWRDPYLIGEGCDKLCS
jgi:hypothetical protein